ncbi:ABC transporter permease [Paenibacillus glacialis]
MMWGRVLSTDFIKIRGKGIWFLVFLGPIGLIAMQALNFGLRYDYLMEAYKEDVWGGLIVNIVIFIPMSLIMGITLLCSLMANVEHQTSSWKQLLALPVSRMTVFSAKFGLGVILLLVSCALLVLGTIALGLGLQLGTDIPYQDIVRFCFLPFIGTLPILALQLWLSLTYSNQAISVSMGITIAIASLFAAKYDEWVPMKWPNMALDGPHQIEAIVASLFVGFTVLLLGMAHFSRKDVA